MYRLLLPLDANAGRHLSDEKGLSTGFWVNLLHTVWGRILHPRGASRR